MRKSIFFNKIITTEQLNGTVENLEPQISVEPVALEVVEVDLVQKEAVTDSLVVSPNTEETQPVIAENLPEVKVSWRVRRRRKKKLRKKIWKIKRARRKRRRLRKKDIAFLSKHKLYSYFLPKKPLLPNAKKKEIRMRIRKTWVHKITIKITSNNIFCTLVDRSLAVNRILLATSAGQSKIKITKKRLKRQHKPFLKKFFAKVWPHLGWGGIMIFITAPIRLRKKIMSLVLKLRDYRLKSKKKRGRRAVFIKVWRKKCFNGCQSAKRRRKKRKGIRLTK